MGLDTCQHSAWSRHILELIALVKVSRNNRSGGTLIFRRLQLWQPRRMSVLLRLDVLTMATATLDFSLLV